MRFLLFAPLLVACGPAVSAIVDDARSEHFFDAPWPTDTRLDDQGHPDLTGYPEAAIPLTANLSNGWTQALASTAVGFGNNTGAYFRFDGALDLPDTLPGDVDDPVVWIDAATGERAPLELRFVDDPAGDPYLASNLLMVTPQLGHAPSSGATVVVAVRGDVARPADGWSVDGDTRAALDQAGVTGKIGVSTTFTVQDATGQLRTLAQDAESRIDPDATVTWIRVERLEVTQGQTPSGEDATLYTAFFEGGESETTYVVAMPGVAAYTIDLLDPDYPAVVYQGTLTTWAYQDLEARPFMRPGLGHIRDIERNDGWIDFDAQGLISVPVAEPMRLVAAVPRDAGGEPADATGAIIYDHGTSGHAYNFIQRRNPRDDGESLVAAWAGAGWAVVGRDASLYGQRFPLLDEGFGDGSLGFYNVVNLPAFRDNQRQTALDGQVLLSYIESGGLSRDLPIAVSADRIRRQGHSLGSVTSNLGLAMDPGAYEAALLTGTGGVFSHYALDTGLLGNGIDGDTLDAVFGLFGAPVPEQTTTRAILGAAIGSPEPAWDLIDRQHPLLHLFQWTMDPSDPMAVARDEAVPTLVVIAPGDFQTPDFTAEALSDRLPDATVVRCEATGDYDPHSCLWREPAGPAIVREWAE